MKFGDTLYQRSVPEWAINNIDYNEIKQSIKIHTTDNTSGPRAIPNGSNEVAEAQQFEDRLYVELQHQHDRVNDFVHVKTGELSRRLTALHKQLSKLEVGRTSHERTRFSAKRAERFSKSDKDAQRVGREIDSLSRFAQANSLAIRKLLKKYRRWTGSRALEERFRTQVFDQNSSFSKRNFGSIFGQYTSTLEAIRKAQIKASQKRFPKADQRRSSGLSKRAVNAESIDLYRSAFSLHTACENDCALDFDTAFAIEPLGANGTRAVYWVHEDNVMHVQILLSQHTMQRRPENEPIGTMRAASSRLHSREPANDVLQKNDGRTETGNYGVVMCDDLQHFVRRQSSETVDDIERSPGKTRDRGTMTIRLCSSEDVLITVDLRQERESALSTLGHSRQFVHGKASKKAVQSLFCLPRENPVGFADQKELTEISKWLSAHPQVKPLVKISCHRDRFCGINNSAKGSLWATFDQSIYFALASGERIMTDKSNLSMEMKAQQGAQRFPHAILEVQTEGNHAQALTEALDASHLVERVRGFSVESHAIAALYKPHDTPLPYWMTALESDIRKVPEFPITINEQEPKTKTSSEPAGTAHTSFSVPSTVHRPSSGDSQFHGESSVTSIREASDTVRALPNASSKTKRKWSKNRASDRDTHQHSKQSLQQRYWNEYDDRSDEMQEETYAIYVRPNTSKSFPGAAMISRLWAFIGDKIMPTKQNSGGSLRPSRSHDFEREPLVNSACSSAEDSEPSDEETVVLPASRSYSTFSARSKRKPDFAKETVLLRSCISAFATSYIMLFIAIILLSTGHRRAIPGVEFSVVVAVCVALIFSVVGLGSMMARQTNVGWIHRTIVLLVFVCAFLVGPTLLVVINQQAR